MTMATIEMQSAFPENYPDILVCMGNSVASMLKKYGVLDTKMHEAMFDITECIREAVGGINVYIPSGQAFKLSQRGEQIYADFNGRNYHALAIKYKLSEVSIRGVVKAGRLRDQKRRQMTLAIEE